MTTKKQDDAIIRAGLEALSEQATKINRQTDEIETLNLTANRLRKIIEQKNRILRDREANEDSCSKAMWRQMNGELKDKLRSTEIAVGEFSVSNSELRDELALAYKVNEELECMREQSRKDRNTLMARADLAKRALQGERDLELGS